LFYVNNNLGIKEEQFKLSNTPKSPKQSPPNHFKATYHLKVRF